MHKSIQIIGIVFLVIALVLVRAFSAELFYDPFIMYFKNDYLHSSFPEFKIGKLLGNIFFRYALNTILSLGIIYLLFQKKYLFFSLKFYGLAFIILLILFFIAFNYFNTNYLFLFYVRRFLVHTTAGRKQIVRI
jgi:exosortase F-associated protein